MTRNRKLQIIGSACFVGVVAIAVGGFIILRPKPFIPKPVAKQLTSTALVPSAGQGYTLDKPSVKYDATNKLLSYKSTLYGSPCIVSEQPVPEQFTDVPQAYDAFISQSSSYDSFESANGKVYLIKPQGVVNAAVTQAKGTLLFIRCDKQLTGDQWRQLFNNLDVVK